MVCSICQESFFKAPPKRGRARGSTSSAARNEHRPAALGCGHTFHKKCINAWFVSSGAQLCPQCKVAHTGPATVLFIDLDDEDFEASKGKPKSTARTSNNCPCGNAEMRQLAWSMVSMNIDNKDGDFYIMCELASQNEELENMNATLQEELEDAYHALNGGKSDDEELDELAIQLAEQCNQSRRAEASLQEKTESLWLAQEQLSQLEVKVATLETLSGRHRIHIANLQWALSDRKKEIGEYQSRYGALYF
ncbi:hypothetical protein GGI09_003980 [Coemansia sp. S100]|nr:hypothetical protein LPJ71_004119 [Coemansia sp. S17]KAJ2097164.1 hypothetical protein GGI09_003980 [Coemansia sp. S100]KAJ2104818.1 hypothetical protein GGI16_002615 [Coemansia sp. S142-1]